MEEVAAPPDLLGPRDFARLLDKQFGLRMSHQAVSKAPYLPKGAGGRIIVQDALAMLAGRGRISLDAPGQQQALLLDGVAAGAVETDPISGRPSAKTNGYYGELTLTEKVKRRKLELELAEKEGKLLRIDDVTEAMVTAARKIGDRIERITGLTDQLVSAARDEGTNGVRDILRREARSIRESLAELLSLAATEIGEEDEQG